MTTAITNGIKVSIETHFQEDYSDVKESHFVFTYRVLIENMSDYTVQLISRKWHVCNAFGFREKIEGDGVVGKQPILEPGEKHQYVSGCNLQTEIGKMSGSYIMERLLDGSNIEVEIPEFVLSTPYRLN
ncbi:Co2+/Mg2+ efflux protein ApaG [Limibacter armeniacum]|uniref:Co2+/Mg2+ efflux protein ApaG n=1 Tax=Limibacter armeniacum TaxID=466084 RepID=UPI002FE6306A